MFKKKISLLFLAACLGLLLCGCAKTIKFAEGQFKSDETSISIVLHEGETALLDGFTALESADFSGSSCIDEIKSWADNHPEVSVTYTVELPDGTVVDNRCSSVDFSTVSPADLPAAVELLKHLPIENINLGNGGFGAEHIGMLHDAAPGANIKYSFDIAGVNYALDSTDIDLSRAQLPEVQKLISYLPYMADVKSIDLGAESNGLIGWDEVSAINAACPDAELIYSFSLYGKDFTLADTELNLFHIKIDDDGALVKKIVACMPNLTYVDMDSCGVSGESMAEIRDMLPNANVVWRVWFGERYSVRTDVEKILASNPGLGGEITPENSVELKYCTKVKYLDLGHNSYMSDLSFLAYMPDLEVLIIAMAPWDDLSPLANCTKLEYAEIQTSGLNDLTPLAGLKNLRHLNIGYCFVLHDLSPIYDLELERLWIGRYTPIPPEQIEEYKRRHPDCEVNTTTHVDPNAEGWRYLGWDEYGVTIYAPRYGLLRDQFGYQEAPYCYSYYWNDPLC